MRATLAMDISFATPPINEVVIGLSFLPRPDFLVPHFGKFWSEISDRYPKVAHATPVLAPNAAPVQDETGAWLPRVWFMSADESYIVQLQQDCMFFNWRHAVKDEPYPRFPSIRDEFYRVLELFQAFLERETQLTLLPTRIEIQYVNAIPQGEGWESVAGFDGVLRDFRWSNEGRYLPSPRRYAGNFDFELPNGVSLQAKISMGVRKMDGREVLRLELAAARMLGDGVDMKEWVNRAHDGIVQAFRDLTTPEMQKRHWQFEGRESNV
jgi:uncharacterized protein (TIGR04255 family)